MPALTTEESNAICKSCTWCGAFCDCWAMLGKLLVRCTMEMRWRASALRFSAKAFSQWYRSYSLADYRGITTLTFGRTMMTASLFANSAVRLCLKCPPTSTRLKRCEASSTAFQSSLCEKAAWPSPSFRSSDRIWPLSQVASANTFAATRPWSMLPMSQGSPT